MPARLGRGQARGVGGGRRKPVGESARLGPTARRFYQAATVVGAPRETISFWERDMPTPPALNEGGGGANENGGACWPGGRRGQPGS